MGHIHELLTGDFYHQQMESVPEQTWSSAAFLSSAVHGLLGLEREAQANRLVFSPHLPSGWDRITVGNIQVPGGRLTMTLIRMANGLELQTENSGGPVELVFAPEVPLGAHLQGAELDGKHVDAQAQENAQDEHANLRFTVSPGKSHCLLRYEGGVSLSVSSPEPLLGESSKGIKIISAAYKPGSLVVKADVSPDGSAIELRTKEKPLRARGAALKPVSDDRYELIVEPTPGAYRHIEITVDFAAKAGKPVR
jgi:hypothetical protein